VILPYGLAVVAGAAGNGGDDQPLLDDTQDHEELPELARLLLWLCGRLERHRVRHNERSALDGNCPHRQTSEEAVKGGGPDGHPPLRQSPWSSDQRSNCNNRAAAWPTICLSQQSIATLAIPLH
jgi:hypothetical protein